MVFAALCLGLIQGPPPETTPTIVTAHKWVVRLGAELGDSIWPGFRPDTIPVLYVVRGQGTLVLGWRGTLPEGFLPIAGLEGSGWQPAADRGAASTGSELAGRATAQVVVSDSLRLEAHPSAAVIVGSTFCAAARFGSPPRPGLGMPPSSAPSTMAASGIVICTRVALTSGGSSRHELSRLRSAE